MDNRLLIKLFSIYSPSLGEGALTNFLCNWFDDNAIPFKKDKYGNIYSLYYENKPILCAHQDCVGKAEDGELLRFMEFKQDIYGNECLISRGNIAGDDKCGIFIILSYLKEVSKEINFMITVGEEISAPWGIPYLIAEVKDDKVWKSVPYVLNLDRKGRTDILCTENMYGSKQFEEQLVEVGKDFGFKPAKGYFSDCNTIRYFKNCCNLSVGYYNAHTQREFVVIEEMMNTLEFVKAIVEKITEPVDICKQQDNIEMFLTRLEWSLYKNFPELKEDCSKIFKEVIERLIS